MNYSLGNMLGGAGALNADKLALNLQFATDKTLTARRGPTPVFTRASTATFVGSNGLIQSAAINTARFDHDPITLACKGLLIEESRTNLALRSDDLANATWTQLQATITANTIASPDGLITADRLNEDSTAAVHQVIQQAPTLTASQPYTFSVFAKAASHTTFQMVFSAVAFGGTAFANFILTGSGSVGTSSGVTTRIEAYPNGWYRCSITIASVTGGASGFIQLVGNNNNSSAIRLLSYTGTSAQVVHLWGAQLELGLFPTSYIPTITASVVRSADICSITGANFTSFYNQSEGTVYTESRPAAVNGTTTTFSLSNGTASERWLNRFAQNEQVVITSAGTESTLDSLNPVAGTLYKTATAGKLNDFALSINGIAVVTDTSQPMPNADRAGIGNATGAVAGGGAVTIASIRYYKKRLPNAKLVTLST